MLLQAPLISRFLEGSVLRSLDHLARAKAFFFA